MRIRRSSACFALLVAVGALFARPARAGSTASSPPAAQPAPPAPGTLTVAMSGSYWPLHEETGAGEREGLEAELAQDLARLLGTKVRFVGRAETGSGSLEAVASGKADVALSSITPTDERRKLVDFTRPYLVLHYRMAAREADVAAALEPAGKRIATPRGPALAVVKALLPRATAVEVASPEAAVQAVLKGAADLAFGEDVGMVLAIQGRPLGLVGPPLAESPIAIAVPKGTAARYDEALAKLSGRIAELVETYRPGEPPDVPPEVYLSFAGGVDAALVRVVLEPLSVTLEEPKREVEWHPIGGAGVEISFPARQVPGPPAAIVRRVGEKLHAAASAIWLKLPDGTFIGFDSVSENQQCGGTEAGPDGKPQDYSYDCPTHSFRIVAVRGDRVDSVSFDVSEGT